MKTPYRTASAAAIYLAASAGALRLVPRRQLILNLCGAKTIALAAPAPAVAADARWLESDGVRAPSGNSKDDASMPPRAGICDGSRLQQKPAGLNTAPDARPSRG